MEITDILTLSDGNEYMITSKAEHDYKIYLCLVDIKNNQNIKFCYLENNEVVIVKKEDLSSVLVLKLLRNMSSIIGKLNEDNN